VEHGDTSSKSAGIKALSEEDRLEIYHDAISRGLSDAEARGTAWPAHDKLVELLQQTARRVENTKNIEEIIDVFLDAIEEAYAEIDPVKLAVAINDAQIMGSEWWGRDLVPVAEKIIAKYKGQK